MKKYISFAALFAGLILFAVACEEYTDINQEFRPVGSPIVFSATSEFNNGVATKTEYSGDHDNTVSGYSNPYERINWVANDPIKVSYIRGTSSSSSVYTVSAPSSSTNEISEASLQDGELFWADGSGDHVFYAMYPNAGFKGNNSASLSGNTVSGEILATQPISLHGTSGSVYDPAMQYAYMVAREVIAENSDDNQVVLHFVPAMTAFEFKFKLKQGDATRVVKSFTMTSTDNIAGKFSFTINSGTGLDRTLTWNNYQVATSSPAPSKSITVSFGDGVALSETAFLDFTILALPIDIHNVTITFKYSDNTTKSLDLKHTYNSTDGPEFVTFDKCKKYIITNDNVPGTGFIYEVEEISDLSTTGHAPVTTGLGFNVRSYRYPEGSDPADFAEAVPWKIQYSYYNELTDTWTDYADLPANGALNPFVPVTLPDTYTAFGVVGVTGTGVNAGAEYTAGEPRDATIGGYSEAKLIQGYDAAAIQWLSSQSPRGTSTSPFDLSTHPFYGPNINTAGTMNTANCYVVTAPGVYMFPCVYGNAIMHGDPNVSSYDPGSSDAAVSGHSFLALSGVETGKNTEANYWVYYNPHFYNAANNPIDDPYIVTDLGASNLDAVVVWQDTPADKLIISYEDGNVGMTQVGTLDYIWFKIDADKIKPGNIVIALRGTAPGISTKSILWSWHIWVTEKDLTPTANEQITNDAGTFQLMPYNLGWVDTSGGDLYKYDTRFVKFRVVQTDASGNALPIDPSTGDEEFFRVTQVGDSQERNSTLGNNPYYQWGRKDPMIPALSATESKIVTANPEYRADIPQSIIPAQRIGTTLDYKTGITKPWLPLSNLIDGAGHGSTSWIGGMYYPWFTSSANGNIYLNKVDRGPYLGGQKSLLDAAHVTNSAMWTESGGLWTYRTDGSYTQGSHSFEDLNYILSIDRAAHFDLPDLTAVGHYGSTKAQRTVSCAPFNLWNSYIYQEDVPNAVDNKFKTVYDPCPAGFAVPSKQVFIGTTAPGRMGRPNPENFVLKATAQKLSSSDPQVVAQNGVNVGMKFGNLLLPFTGARTYYTVGAGLQLIPDGHGVNGNYWSDSPFQMDVADPRNPQGNHNFATVNAFSYHHSAYLLYFSASSAQGQSYTRGSAATVRPMADPKFLGY